MPGLWTRCALEYLRVQCFEQKVQWILEVDLRKFFDTVVHRQMLELLGRRVQDGVITRLVAKWLNAEKTRLVRFGRPSRDGGAGGGGRPETFDFLGFTHYWGKSRRGNHRVQKKTAKSRFRRTLASIKEWGGEHRYLNLLDQQRKLNEKLRGHDAYYGVTGNYSMLSELRRQVVKLWRKWLGRRNRGKPLNCLRRRRK